MAFKMSPIGRNKDPYAGMAKRGYIAPTQQNQGQGIKIDDPEKGQSTVDKAAEENITWNEPGNWEPANDGTGREKRTTTGTGSAKGYHVGTKKMGNEKWKEFLKTPEGQKWLAAKERSKTEFRGGGEKEEPKADNVTGVQKVGANIVKDAQTYTGNKQEIWSPEKNRYITIGDGMVDYQYRDGLGIGEKIPEGANVNMIGLKEGLNDNIVQDKVGVTTGMKVRDDQNLRNLENIQKVENFTEEPTISDDLDASTTIVEQRTPLYKKYMHNSIAKQSVDKITDSENQATEKQDTLSAPEKIIKTTYISNNASPKPGHAGMMENKQRHDNAKFLAKDLKSRNEGDKDDLNVNLGYQKMLNEVVVNSESPAEQVRGHSIATQCAKSEGGSGCVKKMGSGWKVISNKTGKPWNANYDSEASANAALRAYHAG